MAARCALSFTAEPSANTPALALQASLQASNERNCGGKRIVCQEAVVWYTGAHAGKEMDREDARVSSRESFVLCCEVRLVC